MYLMYHVDSAGERVYTLQVNNPPLSLTYYVESITWWRGHIVSASCTLLTGWQVQPSSRYTEEAVWNPTYATFLQALLMSSRSMSRVEWIKVFVIEWSWFKGTKSVCWLRNAKNVSLFTDWTRLGKGISNDRDRPECSILECSSFFMNKENFIMDELEKTEFAFHWQGAVVLSNPVSFINCHELS